MKNSYKKIYFNLKKQLGIVSGKQKQMKKENK